MLWIKQLTQYSQHLTAHSLLNTNPKARLVEQESWWTMYDGPEFRHFISFVAVAEECNFGKAAQRLHITQPTLSTQIKQLEDWLSRRLFRRVPSGAELTEAGRNLLLYARRILHMRSHAIAATSRKYSESTLPLRLGYSPFVNHSLIKEALSSYREMVPDGQLTSSSDCTAQLVEMLDDGRLDAAIVTLPIQECGLSQHLICQDQILICLRRDDPLAAMVAIPKTVVAERLCVMFHRRNHPACHDHLLRRFKKAGITLRLTESFSAPYEMQFMVKTRNYFGIVREGIELDPELIALPIEGVNIRVATGLVFHPEQQRPVLSMLAYRMTQTWRYRVALNHKKPPYTQRDNDHGGQVQKLA